MATKVATKVLVTGGSGQGIGRAITERCLDDGFEVINFDLNAPNRQRPGEHYYQVDMMDKVGAARALARATQEHEITRLVNCLGIVRPASVEETTLEDLQAVVEINLRVALQCTQAVLPAMKRAKLGRIVSITSRAALGKELRTSYAATKAGLHGMTKTWALELGQHGITVNCVAPGPIEGEYFNKVNPPDSPRTKKIIDAIPVKRMGTTKDVAHAVTFLLDYRSGFMTGQVLYVCGGMTVGLSD